MNLFDQLVNEALKNNTELSSMRIVVEKELLHHDILRTLSEAGLLAQLTFIGGTCLRMCYGAKRLSEDLDFTGGENFNRESLSNMAQVLIDNIKTKYDLSVKVKEPVREVGNVDTWTLQVQTREGRKDLPAQRINIDICAIPSYQKRPMVLLNAYGVDMGTSGLIVNAQSLDEIFADKLIAFALRPNRIKYRDLWDIAWLHQQNIKPAFKLIPFKIKDHKRENQVFLTLLESRRQLLKTDSKLKHEFNQEMTRFLPKVPDGYWEMIVNLLDDYCEKVQMSITALN